MLYLSRFSFFMIIFASIILGATDIYAQNVAKMDISKTGGKFSVWVQKQVSNFQDTMSQISESQFATFIGDGIKAAKQGIAYAKEQYDTAMKFYNDTKDAVLNSTEYKIAMLSKEIAEESKKLKDLEEEREKAMSELKKTTELERINLEEKVKIAQDNFNTSIEIFQTELNDLKTQGEGSEAYKAKEVEITTFKAEQEASIAALVREIEALESSKKSETDAITTQFAEDIYEQGQVIADLTMQMEELVEQDKKEKGEQTADSKQATEEAVEDFSFKKDEFVTLEMRGKREKKVQQKLRTSALDSINKIAKRSSTIESTKEEQEQVTSVHETLNGKSEVLQGAIQQTSAQLAVLYSHMVTELATLHTTATILLNKKEAYRADTEIKTLIDICDYEEEDKPGNYEEEDKPGNLVDSVKGAVSNVQNKVGQAVSTAQNVKQNIEQKVNDVQEITEGVTSTVDSVKDAMGTDSTGLEGMGL